MQQILLIARKDLRSYFTSPIGYAVVGLFLVIVGLLFSTQFMQFVQRAQQYGDINLGTAPNVSDDLVRPLFGNINSLLLLMAPFITMRLIAEEKRDHTIELLQTGPVRTVQITLGKFLAGLGMMMTLLFFTLFYVGILQATTSPDWGVIAGCYLGAILVSCVYVGIGLFWSSRTDNQIVAAAFTIGTFIFFWAIGMAGQNAGPFWADFYNYLSLGFHYMSFLQGSLDSADIFYFLSFTGLTLFATNLSLDLN